MSLDLFPSVTAWLLSTPDVYSTPPFSYSTNDIAEPSDLTDDRAFIHTFSHPSDIEFPPEFLHLEFPVLNSTYRSTLELLHSLPPASEMVNILPSLPTRAFPVYELSEALPHEVTNPLPNAILTPKGQTSLELVYNRVLDLRERLRVEEIISEIYPDVEQLYLDPRSYTTSQFRLRDVRILIIQTCQSLTYIKRESCRHGLTIDIAAIDSCRISQRPPNHPYYMISHYLKPDIWQQFNNYSGFLDFDQVNGGVGANDWDALSANESSEAQESGSSDTLDSLKSQHSRMVDVSNGHILSVDKATGKFDHDDVQIHQWRHSSLEFSRCVHEGEHTSWQRPGVVQVGY